MNTVPIVFLLSIGFVGTLDDLEFDKAHILTFIDLRSRITIITTRAEFYLDNGVPSIDTLFNVDNADELKRLEGELKKEIREDLLDQLVEVWAEMNVRVLKGFRALKALRDEAVSIEREFKLRGLLNAVEDVDIKERIIERVKVLIKNANEIFCVQEGNPTGLALSLAETQLQNLASRLEYSKVKNRLLKKMYSYGRDNLLNTTLHGTQHETAIENWRITREWVKWAILGTMVFIKEPLHSLHNDVKQYVAELFNNIQELNEDTENNVFYILDGTDDEFYRGHLLDIVTILSENNATLYCQQ